MKRKKTGEGEGEGKWREGGREKEWERLDE